MIEYVNAEQHQYHQYCDLCPCRNYLQICLKKNNKASYAIDVITSQGFRTTSTSSVYEAIILIQNV